MPRPSPLAAAVLTLALAVAASCKRERAPEPRPAASTAPAGPFRMADLAAATAFDARVARLSLLASTYQAWLGIVPPDLRARTDAVAPRLDAAVADVNAALAAITRPDDRALAAALAGPATRWPAVLARAREEVLAKDPSRTGAADALAALDDEIGRALVAYRRFRSQWTISDAPVESPPVLGWLQARRDLERIEGALGERMPANGGVSLERPETFRDAAREAAVRARTGAEALDPPRRAQALAWIDGQEQAIGALLELAAASDPPRREKASLTYQSQKVAVLDAAAEYTRLTAARAVAAR